jgi:phosphohistidine phosphatase
MSKNDEEDEVQLRSREKFIVLLRHGIAQKRDGKKPDEVRSLTATGHHRMKDIGRALAGIFPKAEVIYTSPLLRCVQTAEWVSRGYRGKLELENKDALAPDGTLAAVRSLIASSPHHHIICVGHEPTLSAIMLALTAMQSEGEVELKKGGCYGIRMMDRKKGQLEWMLPPGILRR